MGNCSSNINTLYSNVTVLYPTLKGILMKDAGHASFAIALLAVASSACAMTAPAQAGARCHVVEGEKLPAASGGARALCDAIERAAAARGLQQRFTVQVRVKPRAMLSAEVKLPDGRTLPALHMAEMDRPVTRDTLERFGLAIADHIAGGAR